MTIVRNALDPLRFNPNAALPYQLRIEDFRLAAQDVYDFFYDVNTGLVAKGLERLDDVLRPGPMTFTEIYLGQVTTDDFRRNERGELGTRTATLDAKGIAKLRRSWIYRAV